MGQFISKLLRKIWNFFFEVRRIKALIVGLDEAGKTTLLYKLKLSETILTNPTIGFNVEELSYKKVSFTFWDVGGLHKIRPLWRHYCKDLQALIFVINSYDESRIEEAASELRKVLEYEDLNNPALLIFSNKQDLPGAMNSQRIAEKLELHRIKKKNWFIQPSCALTGEGLYEGLDWIIKAVKPK